MELTLYHGGHRLEYDYRDFRPHKNGRWEYGPGLYLTNKISMAQKYAKGQRTVYTVDVILDETKELSNVEIDIDDAIAFTNRFIKVAKRKETINWLERSLSRSGKLYAHVMVNLCLNGNALSSANTVELRRFLVDNGVDYAHDDMSMSSAEVYVIFDPSVILSIKRLNSA